jgi:hypothetical protein
MEGPRRLGERVDTSVLYYKLVLILFKSAILIYIDVLSNCLHGISSGLWREEEEGVGARLPRDLLGGSGRYLPMLPLGSQLGRLRKLPKGSSLQFAM